MKPRRHNEATTNISAGRCFGVRPATSRMKNARSGGLLRIGARLTPHNAIRRTAECPCDAGTAPRRRRADLGWPRGDAVRALHICGHRLWRCGWALEPAALTCAMARRRDLVPDLRDAHRRWLPRLVVAADAPRRRPPHRLAEL